MERAHHFGTGIVWGTIPSGFPVYWVAVPWSSRNGYGTSPYLWVQKKHVKFRQGTQNTRLRPTEFFWEFFSHSPFNLFRDLGDVFLSHSWIKCVLWLTVPGNFRCFSRIPLILEGVPLIPEGVPLIPQSCHDTEGKVQSAVKTELKFYSDNKMLISTYDQGIFQWRRKQLMILTKGTIPEGYSLYNNNCTSVSPIYTFPWRET